MILLDTNVVSEVIRARPDPSVARWLAARPADDIFVSAITEAELRFGVALLPEGRRRSVIAAAVEGLIAEDFAGRVWPFDSDAAVHYGTLAASRRQAGRPISVPDAQIAAIALARGAVLATRNVADFADCGVTIINPWTGG
jgi:predicted nucleic acid-binding protein